MYFVKYHPLKEQLRDRTFTDRDGLPYYILFIASSTFLVGFPTATSSSLDVVSAAISTVIAILGTIYSYRKNGGKTGYDFIQKSIVLGWVVIFRCVFLLLLTIVVIYLTKEACGLPMESTSWVDIIFSALFLAWYYQRLGRHIQDTNRSLSEPAAIKD